MEEKGMTDMAQSLCWSCQKAYGGCPWSAKKAPVKGWRAKKMFDLGYGRPSYVVLECPLYEKEKFWKGDFDLEDFKPGAERRAALQKHLKRAGAVNKEIELLLPELDRAKELWDRAECAAYIAGLEDILSELFRAKEEVLFAIRSVDDLCLRNVLILRYLVQADGKEGYTFDKIGEILGYDRWHVIKYLHPKALDKIKIPPHTTA